MHSTEEDGQPSELHLSASALLGVMQAVLEKGLPFRFQAKGSSMSPFIKDGDVLVLTHPSNGELRVGDVVAARYPGSDGMLIHRVLACRDSAYLLKGDNNLRDDGYFDGASILARVISAERNGEPVFWGGGPERRLIAFASRKCLLTRLIAVIRRIRGLPQDADT